MPAATQHAVTCPECGSPMVLRETRKFQWKNGHNRLFYGCSTYPECRGVHGAHPDGRPLGIPGDKPTKDARRLAHGEFDALILERGWSKGKGYRWLGKQLGMVTVEEIKEKCHIAMFGIEQCARVVSICVAERTRAAL